MPGYAFHCGTCGNAWPNASGYHRCPICQKPARFGPGKAMTNQEARLALRTHEFDEFYREREEKREGAMPEAVGLEEARDLAAKWREIELIFAST